jgi:ribosomal protein S18 acetylase RimI-like enzyme
VDSGLSLSPTHTCYQFESFSIFTIMTITDASTIHIPIIQDIAEKTWWPTYSATIEEGKIRFLLDAFYSTEALNKAITDHSQQFIILYDENGPQGFASYGPKSEDPSVIKLHKIYVLPENQGKGYGKSLIDEVITRIKQQGFRVLDLNVYRHNSARYFYERMGFYVVAEENIKFGPYWMDDFHMRLELK